MNQQTKTLIEAAQSISREKLARSSCAGKMSRGEVIKAGYLTKSPPDKTSRVAQWHKRWFVLADSRLVYPMAPRFVRLEYYQSEEEAKKLADPKGVIKLSECKEIANREPIRGHKFVFDVCTQGRDYHLAAESIEEKQQWIGTLNKILSTGVTEGGQAVPSKARERWSPPHKPSDSPPLKRELPRRPLSYTDAKDPAFSSRPLPPLPLESPKNRPLPPTPPTSNPYPFAPQQSHPLTTYSQYSTVHQVPPPTSHHHKPPPNKPKPTPRAKPGQVDISAHYEVAPGQPSFVHPQMRPSGKRKVPTQPRSLDGFCISIPESEGSHREYLNISDDPPDSIKKLYSRKPRRPEIPRRGSEDSQREYINLADDESQSSRREYVNLPDESEDLKQEYVNLPDESEDLKQDYVNLPDEPEDPKMEYINQTQPGTDTDYSYLQHSNVPGYDPRNMDYSHLENVTSNGSAHRPHKDPKHQPYKRKGYENVSHVPQDEGDYSHLRH